MRTFEYITKKYLNHLKYDQICEKIQPKIGQGKYTWDNNTFANPLKVQKPIRFH